MAHSCIMQEDQMFNWGFAETVAAKAVLSLDTAKSVLWPLHGPRRLHNYGFCCAQIISNQLQYSSGTLSVPSGSSSPSNNRQTSWLQLRSRPWDAAAWQALVISAAAVTLRGGHINCDMSSPDSVVNFAWKRCREIWERPQVTMKVGGTSRTATFRAPSNAPICRCGGTAGSSGRTE